MASGSGRAEDADDAPPAHGFAGDPAIDRIRGGTALTSFTRWLAVTGGVLLIVAVAITLVSVIGRYAFSWPVPGDYEIVEMLCAVGIFLFFPYTHAVNGNITAEFFTSGLSVRKRRALDTIHDVVFAVLGATITWRMLHGLADKFATGEGSALIRIPIWWAYSFAVASMALLTLVCVWRVIGGIAQFRR